MKDILEKVLYLTIFLFIGFNFFNAARIMVSDDTTIVIAGTKITIDDYLARCKNYCNAKKFTEFCEAKGIVDFNDNDVMTDYFETQNYGFFEKDLGCFLITNCTYNNITLNAINCNKLLSTENFSENQIYFDFGYMVDINNNLITKFPFQYNPKYKDHWYVKQFSINGTTYSIQEFQELSS